MKVLYLFGESSGGIANYIRGLTKDSMVENFLVYTSEDDESLFKSRFPGFSRIEFNFHTALIPVLYRLWILAKNIKKNDIDIINSHALKFGLYMVILKLLLPRKIRFVYTDHGSPYLQCEYFWKRSFLYLVECVVTFISDTRICIRENEYQVWKNKSKNVALVKTRVSLPNLKQVCKKARKTNVLMVGPIYDLKNPCFFKDVAETFEHDSKVNFSWIGPEGSDASLNQCIIQSVVVNYLGELEFPEVQRVMCEADILLLTSKVEVTPLVMFEAFSSETLVISNDWLGVEGFIDHGANGFILNNVKSVVDVIDDYSKNKKDYDSIKIRAKKNAMDNFSNLTEFRNEYLRILYG